MPKNLRIFHFPGYARADLSQVGGKAFSLLRGSEAGLPVPPGAILPVEFFASWFEQLKGTAEWSAFLRAQPEQLPKACNDLKLSALRLSFDDEQESALSDALQGLVDRSFAVRSSSPEEDLEGTSFAGGYETILGVTPATVHEAIKRSFASCLDFRIVAYKREHRFGITDPKIAIVIQEQIASECAGIGFSLNPVTNDLDDAVLNSNWGLGESVVSGAVTPDAFVVNKVSMLIKHKLAGSKEHSIWLTPTGGTEEKANQRRDEFSLTEEQILSVTELVKRVEDLYKRPMDIEWAYSAGKLYLLQARPITAYVPLPEDMVTAPGQRKRLYLDVTISVQGLHKPLSPMGTSVMKGLVRRVAQQVFGFPEPFANIDAALVWIAWGRMYVNLSNAFSRFGKERIAIGLANLDPLASKTLRQIDPALYQDGKHRRSHLPLKLLWQIPPYALSLMEAALFPEQAQRSARLAISTFMRDAPDMARSNMPVWELVDRLLIPTIRLVLRSSSPLFLSSRIAREKMKSVVGKENEPLLDTLERALPNNVTTEMGLALYHVSQMTPGSPAYEKSWANFIELYGHRGPVELDVASPRYRDKPQLLLDQIEMLRKSSTDLDNPQRRFDQAQVERRQGYQQVLRQIRGKGWVRTRMFQFLYRVWETLSGYREMHKYLLIFSLDILRQRLLKEADVLLTADRIDTREQIFDLTIEDLRTFVNTGEYDLRAAARRNREPHDRLAKVSRLPALIDSRGLIPPPGHEPAREGEAIGTAISPGIVRGRIKVLHAPDEKPLLRGEILVARATDPGWTPLFVNAAAVILEVGGVLQHGALVAREYGLPCVSGVEGATELWNDGTEVEVDGSAGIVRIVRHNEV